MGVALTTLDIEERARRRRVIERSWVALVLGYTVVRVAVAFQAIGRYDATAVWIFGAVDLLTAAPYAIGTARLVVSLIDGDRRAAVRWGMLASSCFLAPYAWLAWSGRNGRYPAVVYLALAVFVVCFGGNAIYGVRRRVRSG